MVKFRFSVNAVMDSKTSKADPGFSILGRYQSIILANFSRKLHENEKKWTKGWRYKPPFANELGLLRIKT